MKHTDPEDFSKFIKNDEKSRKERLIEECKKHDVSIHVDDESETSSGAYAEMRAVASEAELERRLNAKKSVGMATRSSVIAIIALIVSVLALIKSFLP